MMDRNDKNLAGLRQSHCRSDGPGTPGNGHDAVPPALDQTGAGQLRRKLRMRRYGRDDGTQSALFVVEGLIPTGLTLFLGIPSTGKTFLAIDLGLHLAAGQPWFGHAVRQGSVYYLAAEGIAGIARREMAFRLDRPTLTDVPFTWVLDSLDLLDAEDLDALIANIAADADGRPIAAVIIDTLSRTLGGGDENGADMARYVSSLTRIGKELGCAVVVVHHVAKNGNAHLPRGHSCLWGAADACLLVERTDAERTVSVEKMKDGPDGGIHGFELETVAWRDGDAKELTSCVVRPAECRRRIPQSRLSLSERRALRHLEALLGSTAAVTPPSGTTAAEDGIDRVVSLEAWCRTYAADDIHKDIKVESAQKSFERARKNLITKGLAAVEAGWAWLTPPKAQTSD